MGDDVYGMLLEEVRLDILDIRKLQLKYTARPEDVSLALRRDFIHISHYALTAVVVKSV